MNEEMQNQNPDSNSQSTESQEQVTQPTSQPSDYNQTLMTEAYRESERARIQLMQENQALRAQTIPQQSSQNSYEEINRTFFERPGENIAQLIEKEVQKSINPIAQEFRQYTRLQQYQTLKNNYRSLPNFTVLESLVDQLMINQEPIASNMNAAITMAIGQLTLAGQYSHQQVPQNNTRVLPPNLAPSNPPAPQHQSNPTKINLTEMQKRVARENGMTDEQYISYLTADSKEVITMERK